VGGAPAQARFSDEAAFRTKLGIKNPKHIGEIQIGNDFNSGYWETHG